MRKTIITVSILFLNLFTVCAQNADMRISELINSSDWFALEKEYPKLKDSIQYAYVGLMAEAMIAQNFNREKDAIEPFRTLINKHQQQIGSGTALVFAEMTLGIYERCGMYALAAQKANGLIGQIKSSGAPVDYSNLIEIQKRNEALSKYDSTMVIRNRAKDLVIPFTTEKTDTALFDNQKPVPNRFYIPAIVHGETHQFMFDTGASTTYLSKRFADFIGVKYVGYSFPIGDLAYLDSLQLGDVTFKNVIALVHDGTLFNGVCTIDAVLGMDLVRQLDELRIDNKKNQIIFPAKQSKMPEYGRNLRCTNQLLFVEATDSAGSLAILLDSGAESGFFYNYFVKHRNELSQLRGTKEIVSGNVYGLHSTMAIHVPSVKFNICNQNIEMKDVYVPYMKNEHNNRDDMALGIDFFMQYDKIILNFKEMFMTVE